MSPRFTVICGGRERYTRPFADRPNRLVRTGENGTGPKATLGLNLVAGGMSDIEDVNGFISKREDNSVLMYPFARSAI
jgi:hypothetical protein